MNIEEKKKYFKYFKKNSIILFQGNAIYLKNSQYNQTIILFYFKKYNALIL